MSGLSVTQEVAAGLRWWQGECHEAVVRDGQDEPCERTAVAVRLDMSEGGSPYPVCTKHARSPLVPLHRLVAAMREDQP